MDAAADAPGIDSTFGGDFFADIQTGLSPKDLSGISRKMPRNSLRVLEGRPLNFYVNLAYPSFESLQGKILTRTSHVMSCLPLLITSTGHNLPRLVITMTLNTKIFTPKLAIASSK